MFSMKRRMNARLNFGGLINAMKHSVKRSVTGGEIFVL